jgi:zinc D-Ala-D-Ala carboxypeptidase
MVPTGYVLAGLGLLGAAGLAAALTRSGKVMREKPGSNFDYGEFEVTRSGLPNALPLELRRNVDRLVEQVLEPLRADLAAPIRITSGYRSAAVNRAIGGSATSDHLRGMAADFVVVTPGYSSTATVRRILELGLPFDQLIAYAPQRGGHVHVGLRPSGNRRQALWAPPGGGFRPFSEAPTASVVTV